MQNILWYFDFIFPFAYLQLSQLKRLPASCEIEYCPILFAGLLEHWQNAGPPKCRQNVSLHNNTAMGWQPGWGLNGRWLRKFALILLAISPFQRSGSMAHTERELPIVPRGAIA